MINRIHAWFQCVEGATAIEYALIAGGISLAIVASVLVFGGNLANMFDLILAPMDQAVERVSSGS